jgi:outer membrane protein TolC
MKRRLIFTSICVLIGIVPAIAQFPVAPSLNAAIEAALAYNTQIKNQTLEQRKSTEAARAVWNKYLPQLSATAAYAYLNHDLKIDVPTVQLPLSGAQLFEGSTTLHNKGNVFLAGLTAKQVLFSGGQILYGAKAMEAKNEGDRLMSETHKDEVIRDVIQSFDQLRLLKQAEQLMDEMEIRFQKETERVEKAIAQGLAVPYDRDKLKLASLNLASRKSELEGKKELLYLKIGVLTGYDTAQIQAVQYELIPVTFDLNPGVADRNEWKALSAYEKALDYKLKKERGSLLPTLGAFASYGYGSLFQASSSFPLTAAGDIQGRLRLNEATVSPNWLVAAVFRWELFGGFERRHKIHEVKTDREILNNRKQDAARMLNLQIQNNRINYQQQMNQVAIASQKVTIADHNLSSADKQYKLGLINVTERLTAESDWYEAKLEQVQALVNQRQAALQAYAGAAPLQSFIQIQ